MICVSSDAWIGLIGVLVGAVLGAVLTAAYEWWRWRRVQKRRFQKVERLLKVNLQKWQRSREGENRKTDRDSIYEELRSALSEYRELMMLEPTLSEAHLAAFEALTRFTEYDGAGVQPQLFTKAEAALKEAFS